MSLLFCSNYFVHQLSAPVSSSLHFSFLTVQGSIFWGFWGVVVFFCLILVFSLFLFWKHFPCHWWCGRCKSGMVSACVPKSGFPNSSNTRKRLPRARPGAGVPAAALPAASVQVHPSRPSVLQFCTLLKRISLNLTVTWWSSEVSRHRGSCHWAHLAQHNIYSLSYVHLCFGRKTSVSVTWANTNWTDQE